jgi:hypothetical protein
MRKVASVAGILIIIFLISAVYPLQVQGWAGWPGVGDLHFDMTEDALNGARVSGLLQ